MSLLLATTSKAIADEGSRDEDHNHKDLKPHTHVAYHHVENSCATDVEEICKEEIPPMFMLSADPFFTWVLSSPSTPSSEVYDLNRFIDQMFDSVLVSSSYQSSSSLIFIEVGSPQFIVDFGVARLAAEKQPEEIPQLANELQNYGANMLLNAEDGSDEFRMARRLTEMDTKTINYHVQLPFGRKNCCLRHAFEQQRVSPRCASSISTLEKTFVLEDKFSRRQDAFVNMMWIYVTTLTFLTFMLARRIRKQDDDEAEIDEESIDDNDDFEETVYYAFGDNEQKKTLLPVKKIVYEGVLLQIV
ncbi:hypothetical protein FRACYDRAFT_239772 [Fragilariopsis cylindrus CCMP1102]|uniref:Uncharacterized protein n=1 Tax=Fragilariopsis cylindrus CCMP1102 TaxID=635003 RepID=A0A1E7FA83_9STRA|nr:hypothetical protein FRACYDRAFT_239772 [Fragilariopsis cylindrus CCMP1102]|eukprot:OEU15092.1 hypothetical protein FRACYDRAFT_239772 [Fragilariopsis cylindrus CCMP1102]